MTTGCSDGYEVVSGGYKLVSANQQDLAAIRVLSNRPYQGELPFGPNTAWEVDVTVETNYGHINSPLTVQISTVCAAAKSRT